MLRLRAILAALLLGAPLGAQAAEVTRIASSFDEDDPFDLFLDVRFRRTQTHTKVTREQLSDQIVNPEAPDDEEFTPGRIERPEVWHRGSDTRLDIALAIGLYKDLEFSFGLPLILQQNDNYAFVSDTNDSNSTIINNRLNPDGSTTVSPRSLFTVPSTSKRGGLGNMRFGLAYAFFNQNRDDTKPMWLIGLDYELPTAKQRDPSLDNTGDDRGNVGDRVHKYTFYTSFSRKMGVADPYFKAHYTVPVQGPGIYSNCFDGESQGVPGNCFVGKWTRKETGIKAPHVTGFLFGSEFTAFSDKNKGQKFALDVRAIGTYVSSGRYYNELSAALGKLLATQEYFQVGGQFGATASAGEAFTLRASGTFLYNTDHALTNENLGVAPEEIRTSGGVLDPASNTNVNPNFDFRTDLVSRRFRATESKTFRLELSAAFAF
ncbi:hypothetical protein [Hyalangium sp.]|uniref:hypothetical protein n=1 Tax=Hyalangium sp. TaxID=2028555 RepID=UPI002D2515ED|nr:hypothetical protein [Hyalangium sp.]HYH99770.1 hypothetical protein [Hyalangium sp.]